MPSTRPSLAPRTSAQKVAYASGRRVHRRHFAEAGRTFPGISTVEALLTERQQLTWLRLGDRVFWQWFERGWWSYSPDRG